jgi:hypothetical protein
VSNKCKWGKNKSRKRHVISKFWSIAGGGKNSKFEGDGDMVFRPLYSIDII